MNHKNTIQTIENTPLARMEFAIVEKGKAEQKLKAAINSHTTLKLDYLHKGNKIMLDPKLKEKMGLSKAPSEKMKQAHIEETYSDLKNDVEIAKENVAIIKREIELLDDEISLYKYQCQMEMKE